MESTLITVASYSLLHEAEVDRTLLESEGIPAFLADANIVNTNWFLSNAVGGVKLQVREVDVARARALLDEVRKNSPQSGGWGKCDRCGGENLSYDVGGGFLNLGWLLTGLPLFGGRRKLRCQDCGAERSI